MNRRTREIWWELESAKAARRRASNPRARRAYTAIIWAARVDLLIPWLFVFALITALVFLGGVW